MSMIYLAKIISLIFYITNSKKTDWFSQISDSLKAIAKTWKVALESEVSQRTVVRTNDCLHIVDKKEKQIYNY